MNTEKTVGIGLVGAGFMGKCHANAFRSVPGLFDVPATRFWRFWRTRPRRRPMARRGRSASRGQRVTGGN